MVYTDPSGYFSLQDVNTTRVVQGVLAGAAIGGVFGGLDALTHSDRSLRSVLEGIGYGAGFGAVLGPFARIPGLQRPLLALFTGLGITGSVSSFRQGEYLQGAYRGVMSALGGYLFLRMSTRPSSSRGANKTLNLGSGTNPMRGAVNVDSRAVRGVDVVADANRLPFGNGTFSEVHSVNPFGFNPVSAETARVMQSGGILRVTGTARNRFAQPMNAADARAAGFEVINSGPMSATHNFGVQSATTGGKLNTSTSVTTTYRKIP